MKIPNNPKCEIIFRRNRTFINLPLFHLRRFRSFLHLLQPQAPYWKNKSFTWQQSHRLVAFQRLKWLLKSGDLQFICWYANLSWEFKRTFCCFWTSWLQPLMRFNLAKQKRSHDNHHSIILNKVWHNMFDAYCNIKSYDPPPQKHNIEQDVNARTSKATTGAPKTRSSATSKTWLVKSPSNQWNRGRCNIFLLAVV